MRRSHVAPDVLRKMRHIEIYTRRLLSGSMIGDARSAQKGTGLEFDQIREYVQGDDVRFVDWKASARMNKLLVKQYFEERSRTVLLAVDVSQSGMFSSGQDLKRDIMAQVASVLGLVANCGNDFVGLLLFSDKIERYVPPRRGTSHVRKIMEHLFAHEAQGSGTSLDVALQHLAQLKRKDAIVFLISDFIDQDFSTYLPVVARTYDMIAVRCLDRREKTVPRVGFVTMEDSETGEHVMLDMRKKGVAAVNDFLHTWYADQDALFRKYGIDIVDIDGDRSFVGDLIKFFCQRMRY